MIEELAREADAWIEDALAELRRLACGSASSLTRSTATPARRSSGTSPCGPPRSASTPCAPTSLQRSRPSPAGGRAGWSARLCFRRSAPGPRCAHRARRLRPQSAAPRPAAGSNAPPRPVRCPERTKISWESRRSDRSKWDRQNPADWRCSRTSADSARPSRRPA